MPELFFINTAISTLPLPLKFRGEPMVPLLKYVFYFCLVTYFPCERESIVPFAIVLSPPSITD